MSRTVSNLVYFPRLFLVVVIVAILLLFAVSFTSPVSAEDTTDWPATLQVGGVTLVPISQPQGMCFAGKNSPTTWIEIVQTRSGWVAFWKQIPENPQICPNGNLLGSFVPYRQEARNERDFICYIVRVVFSAICSSLSAYLNSFFSNF